MHLKILTLSARNAGERLVVKALRQLAAPPPAPVTGREMLARAGVDVRGVSTLCALIALLGEAAAPGIHLHTIGSPFVSAGEMVVLGELGRRQRASPGPFQSGILWPLSTDPAFNILLGTAASALSDANLSISHRTISSAGDLARGMAPIRRAVT